MLQKTIAKQVSFSGKGLFSAEKNFLTLLPAKENTGICFRRQDSFIRADIENASCALRTTVLKNRKMTVKTVEHFLAALYALQISNLIVEIEKPEIPVFDGSAEKFVSLIAEAGIKDQTAEREVFSIQEPVYIEQQASRIIALPSDSFKISCLFQPFYQKRPAEFFSLQVDENSFIKEIAPARTFSFYEEIKPFLDRGLIKGGSLENAVLIKEGKVLNKTGLRFEDEMVRHKILDLIGDLSLSQKAFAGHVIAHFPGHEINRSFVQKLLQKEKKNEIFAYNMERN